MGKQLVQDRDGSDIMRQLLGLGGANLFDLLELLMKLRRPKFPELPGTGRGIPLGRRDDDHFGSGPDSRNPLIWH